MNIGEMRVRGLRVMQYANFVTFAASGLTVLKVYGFPWWYGIFLLPAIAVLYWADGKIVKSEQSYFNQNNEALQQLLRDVQELKNK